MSINKLAARIRRSQNILIFTGAGISTNSGIPDYRGPKGVWKTREPVYYNDFMASESARIEYWDQKLEGWEGFRNAQPNDVHRAVAVLERAGKILKVVTQNIDGLHEKAGVSRKRLIELHGTMLSVECQSCHEMSAPGPHFVRFKKTQTAPLCRCGGYLKSATISFGQSLREADLQGAVDAAHNCDLAIALGSTLSVHPAASITLLAADRGAPYVIINRGVTEHDDYPKLSLRLEGDVSAFFPPAVEMALA